MYFKTLAKSECCACTACEHACPVHAISFTNDEEGFLYPTISKEKCIDCGLCERVCPVEHPNYSNSEVPEVYAAMVKDIEQRKKSSSGGVFYAIASWIILQGGKVYGATMDEYHQVKHIGVDNLEDLNLLRGSKYVQSNLLNVFIDVKKQLNAGRWCYFVGTGCQVAGLKAFLRKKYDNLITSDLVCHGVPSQWLFDQHITYLEDKYKGKVSNYQFRNNEAWGGCEIFDLTNYRGKTKRYKSPSYYLSPYLYSFMYSMTSRYSCYTCKFAHIPRQGDITLADYWGASEFFPDIDAEKGVSLVLINSSNGLIIWNIIKSQCNYMRSCVENGAKKNGNLIKASLIPTVRQQCYNEILRRGYADVARKEFRCDNYVQTKIKQLILNSFLRPIILQIWAFIK